MLALNCMVNPVAGLSGLGTTDVRLEPRPRRLSIALAAEDIARDAKSRSGGRPSLLQDVMRGRNGYVVDEARRISVPVPFNEAIVEIYRRHRVGALKPNPRNLDPMLEKLR
jgi:hypothetical protein